MSSKPASLSDEELFRLLEFFAPGERDHDPELTEFLERELQARRPSEWERANQTERNAYILRLMLACPGLLDSPPRFEWVLRDFRRLLALRHVDDGQDRAFWAAIDQVRRQMRPGRPSRKGRDYVIALMIYGQMNATGLSKTKVIAEVARDLARMAPLRLDTDAVTTKTREIKAWLRRIEDDVRECAALRAKAGLRPVNLAPRVEEPTRPARRSQSVREGVARNPPTEKGGARRTSAGRQGSIGSGRKHPRTPRKARD